MRVRDIGPIEIQEEDGSWRLLTETDLEGPPGPAGVAGAKGDAGPSSGTKLSLVDDFGARMDGKPATANVASGSPDLLAGYWVAGDVGKVVLVAGAGPSGAGLRGTITAVVPGVKATLNTNAATAVTGASLIYGHDDTPAWEAAINAMYAIRGGDLEVEAPDHGQPANSTQFSIVTRPIKGGETYPDDGIYHLKGCNITGSGGGGTGAPAIAYLAGAGAGPMFNMISTFHCHFRGLTFLAANPSFDGDLVMFVKGLGGDARGCTVKRCGFANAETNPMPVLNSYLHWNQVIYCHVEHCDFGENYAGSGIVVGQGYVNVCTIDRNTFSHNRNHILISCGDLEALSIRGNVFEPTWGGQAGAIVGTETTAIYHAEIAGNWFGDLEWGGRSWIENLFAGFQGSCEIHSNVMFSPGAGHSVTVTPDIAGGGGVNEEQLVRVQAQTGNFKLGTTGAGGGLQTTANISAAAAFADPNVIRDALVALSNVAAGDVVVTAEHGPSHPYPFARRVYWQWRVKFQGALANLNIATMVATDVDLKGYGAFFNLGDGLWDIHSNRFSGEGTVLFDLTYVRGGSAGTPSLRFNRNRFAGGDIEKMVSNSQTGNPFADLQNAGVEMSGNMPSVSVKVPATHEDLAKPASVGLGGALTLAPDFTWQQTHISASNLAVTIPPDSAHPDTPFWDGTETDFIQGSAGVITFSPGAGVTLLSRGNRFKTNGPDAVVTLKRVSADLWFLTGDTAV